VAIPGADDAFRMRLGSSPGDGTFPRRIVTTPSASARPSSRSTGCRRQAARLGLRLRTIAALTGRHPRTVSRRIRDAVPPADIRLAILTWRDRDPAGRGALLVELGIEEECYFQALAAPR
jgi:hypothetical protein